jgi:hypothetical protein
LFQNIGAPRRYLFWNVEMLTGMRPTGRGRPAGRPTPGAFADFTPIPGSKHRVSTSVEPELMPDLIRRLEAMGVSASWYLGQVLRRDLEQGGVLPTWFVEESQESDESGAATTGADVLDFPIPGQTVAASGSHAADRRGSSQQ